MAKACTTSARATPARSCSTGPDRKPRRGATVPPPQRAARRRVRPPDGPAAPTGAARRPRSRDRRRARRGRHRARAADRSGAPRAPAPRYRRVRDIGRIGHHEIERRRARAVVAGDERSARAEPERCGIVPRAVERGEAEIGADAGALREARAAAPAAARPSRCRDRRCAARASRLRAKRGERGLDHGLGLRPRHQRFGVEPQRQAPEFLAADDARDRLAREPARGQRGNRFRVPRR